jgi:hypothetical protein
MYKKIYALILIISIGNTLFASPAEDFAYLKGKTYYKGYKALHGSTPPESYCKEKAKFAAQYEREKSGVWKYPIEHFIYGCLGN